MSFLGYVLMYMAIPILWALVARFLFRRTYTLPEAGINLLICLFIVILVQTFGYFSNVSDTEILNGKIISKHREHDSYIESYRCNCYTTCSGTGSSRTCTEHCSTCYRDHYTVEWYAKSTLGNIRFEYLDRTSKSVYNEPDPLAYKKCKEGEPASIEHSYTNYVKLDPNSLFNTAMENELMDSLVPPYPKVHSFYKLDRVIGTGMDAASKKELNNLLNQELITLGKAKQVNIIVLTTKVKDSSFRHVVENKWLGGKKNDVVVFLGIENGVILWNDVMTWALNGGNELFTATLKTELDSIKKVDPVALNSVIVETVSKLYDRPEMKDYEYLKDSFQPPMSVIIACFILSILTTLGLTWYFHRNDIA